MSFLRDLERELTTAGVPLLRRERILSEFTEHLYEDPKADLGDPRVIAQQFGDELGTQLVRCAAFRVFAALAAAGTALVVMFLAVGRMRGLTIEGGRQIATPSWSAPLLLLAALTAQLALAAGGLALLRAWRLRHAAVISARDARILLRRTGVGVISGIVTLTALPIAALAFPHTAGHAWKLAAWILGGLGVAALLATVPSLVAAARVRVRAQGRAGDLRDDLAPWLPGAPSPLTVALLLAAAIVVLATVAGVVTDDPYDGALRGVTDAIACLMGYALLGRYLGLRADVHTSG